MSSKTRIRLQNLLARWAKPDHGQMTERGCFLRFAAVRFMAAREKEANRV